MSVLAKRNQFQSDESPYRCNECGGWFGVPHDFDHDKHPCCLRCAEQCACRRCRVRVRDSFGGEEPGA